MQRPNPGLPSERDAEVCHTFLNFQDNADILTQPTKATSSKASKAEFAKNYDQAFQLYIKTAESFLHLSRSTTADDKNKLKWKASAAKALERAEKIKRFVDKSRTSPNMGSTSGDGSNTNTANIHLTPIGIDHFSPRMFCKKCLAQKLLTQQSKRNNSTYSKRGALSTGFSSLYGTIQ